MYAQAEAIKELSEKQAVPADRVSKVLLRAIAARRPAARYVVPFSSRIMLWFLRTLPTRWADGLMRAALGLSPRKLALAAPSAQPRAAA